MDVSTPIAVANAIKSPVDVAEIHSVSEHNGYYAVSPPRLVIVERCAAVSPVADRILMPT